MKTIRYSNGMMHRSRYSMLIFNVKGIIVEFREMDIPGVCAILNSSYNKNGKWSSTTFELALSDEIKSFHWTEDFEDGLYIPENNWKDAYSNFISKSEFNIPFESFEQFCRSKWKNTAARLDATDNNLKSLTSPELLRAIANKEKLKQEIAANIQKEQSKLDAERQLLIEKEEATKINEKVDKIKIKMKSSMTLEEMQEIYKTL